MYKIIDKALVSIGDLKAILENIPDEYYISIAGISDSCAAIDHDGRVIWLDDRRFIENYTLDN